MRKIISLLLAIAMVMSMTAVAFAAETPSFTDVSESEYYYDSVIWAVANGVTDGMGNNEFQPAGTSTRAQIVTFLWKYAGKPEPTATTIDFTDVAADAWYADSVLWAIENGVTDGMGDGTFQPEANCTRAQIVTFLWKFAGQPEAAATEEPFTDVAETDWFYDAVLWAVENGITTGMTTTTFVPTDPCTRGQIVTFLYRYAMQAEPTWLADVDNVTEVVVTNGISRQFAGKLFGLTMVVEGGDKDTVLTYNGVEYKVDDEGVISVEFPAEAVGRNAIEFSVKNGGADDLTLAFSFNKAVGDRMSPDTLVLGENKANVEQSDPDGYYYTWTATEDGFLSITMLDETWHYVINNLTTSVYGDSQYSDSASVVNPGLCEINEGDKIEVIVSTYDPKDKGNAPAGTVTFTAAIAKDIVAMGEGKSASAEVPITFDYTPEVDGVMTVVISGDPGYKISVANAETDETVNLPTSSNSGDEQTLTYELEAGVTYTTTIFGYADWTEASAVVTYKASFAASEGGEEDEKAEYEVDYDTNLTVGENQITLLDTAVTTLYDFNPTDNGVYTFTIDDTNAKIGYWGAGVYFPVAPEGELSNTLEHTVSTGTWQEIIESSTGEVLREEYTGPSVVIGVSGVESCTLTISRVDLPETGDTEIEYVNYVNTHEFPEGFNNLTGDEELTNVNVAEEHSAVLGDDGYYHLDSVDGEILYVDLRTSEFSIGDVFGESGMGAITLRGEVADESGDPLYYDFYSAMYTYYGAIDENGLYPLTEDLMLFLQGYGKNQGWYMKNLSPFAAIKDTELLIVEDTAWMVLCYYVEAEETATGLQLGDNAVDMPAGMMGYSGTYTAAEAGTLTITVSEFSVFNGESYDSMNPAQAAGMGSYNLFVNEEQVPFSNTTTVDVAAGDVVTVALRSMWNEGKATINLTMGAGESGGEDGGEETPDVPADAIALAIGSNNYAVEAGDADGVNYSFTATEAGTLNITVSSLRENKDGTWTEAGSMMLPYYFSSTQAAVTVNGTVLNQTNKTSVAVEVGTVVSINFAHGQGLAMDGTVELSMAAPAEVGEDSSNPIIIEGATTLSVALTADNALNGIWYQYTAESDCTMTLTYSSGYAYMDGFYNTVKDYPDTNDNGDSLTAELTAGDVFYIHVYSYSGAADVEIAVSIA